MNVIVRKSFEKDAEKMPPAVQKKLAMLLELFVKARKLSDIPACKKLTGTGNYYRVRLGNYRVGFIAHNNQVEFIRVLDRKDIYKYFP